MLMGKFNTYIERHGRITFLILVTLLAISFVLFFTPGATQDLFGGGFFGPPAIGEVAGEAISEEDFYRQLYAVELFDWYLPNEDARGPADLRLGGPAMQSFAPRAFNRLRALHRARQLGLTAVSDDDVRKAIRDVPRWQTDGKFDQQKFDEFKRSYLSQRRLTARDLDEMARQNIAIGRLYRRVVANATATPADARVDSVVRGARSTVKVATFRAADHLASVTVTDEAAREYFAKHREDRYRVPRQVKVLATVFDPADYQPADDSDAAIAQRYEEVKDQPEFQEKQMRLEVLRLPLPEDAGDDAREQAVAKARELRGTILDKDNFAALAKAESAHPSAAAGGVTEWVNRDDLGYISRWGYWAEMGELSDPLVREDGVWLIRKIEERFVTKPLEDIRELILQSLRESAIETAARAIYERDLDQKYRKEQVHLRVIAFTAEEEGQEDEKRQAAEAALRQLREENADFAALATEVSEDEYSQSKGGDVGWLDLAALSPQLRQPIDALEDGQLGDVVQIDDTFYIIRREATRDTVPFAEVSDELIEDLRKEREQVATRAARAAADKLLLKLHEQKVAGAAVAAPELFRRMAAEVEAPHELVETGWFDADDQRIPQLQVAGGAFATAAARLSADIPYSDAIQDNEVTFVACFLDEKASRLPEYDEVANRVRSDLRRELAVAAARDQCAETHAQLVARMDALRAAGEDPKGALEELGDWQEVGPFSLLSGPRDREHAEEIGAVVRDLMADQLTSCVETDNGSILVYVVSQETPDAEQIAIFGAGYGALMARLGRSRAMAEYEYPEHLNQTVPLSLKPQWAALASGQSPE